MKTKPGWVVRAGEACAVGHLRGFSGGFWVLAADGIQQYKLVGTHNVTALEKMPYFPTKQM